jgi:hypothetical protein
MNTNNVVSNIAAADLSGKEYCAVKLTSTGIALAGASDKSIGTLLRGNTSAKAVDVHLTGAASGLHFVNIGNNTAIAIGDEIEQLANGLFAKKASGTAVGQVWETTPANSSGGAVRAILY